jgi:hypothetical protein
VNQLRIRVWTATLLWIALALAAGCASSNAPPPAAPRPPHAPRAAAAPPTVAEQVGKKPVKVYGASVYSPGQKIFQELRQEESLMAFLACQGEPDRVEVVENPDGAPRILLEYSRGGLAQRGTVEIAPSPAGFYAAQPIDPKGSLKRGSAEQPRRPAPPPKQPPKDRERRPDPRPPPVEEPAEVQAEPALPQPTSAQLEECPIEPWRSDCHDLCGPDAGWDWCQYED